MIRESSSPGAKKLAKQRRRRRAYLVRGWRFDDAAREGYITQVMADRNQPRQIVARVALWERWDVFAALRNGSRP